MQINFGTKPSILFGEQSWVSHINQFDVGFCVCGTKILIASSLKPSSGTMMSVGPSTNEVVEGFYRISLQSLYHHHHHHHRRHHQFQKRSSMHQSIKMMKIGYVLMLLEQLNRCAVHMAAISPQIE